MMTNRFATKELAMLIGRATVALQMDRSQVRYITGCLAILAHDADVPIMEIREAIHPLDYQDCIDEAEK